MLGEKVIPVLNNYMKRAFQRAQKLNDFIKKITQKIAFEVVNPTSKIKRKNPEKKIRKKLLCFQIPCIFLSKTALS